MKKEKDIFDKIMEFPILRIFEPFYRKYKEVLLYLFFGVLTFIISIVSYGLLAIKLDVLIANILSWILAVIFAYITNRVWVFDNIAAKGRNSIYEMLRFITGRIFTLIVEELILYFFITRLEMDKIIVKIIAQIIVIVLNYIISKLLVFNRKGA